MRYATRTILAVVSAVLLLAAGLAAQKTDSAQALLRTAMDTAVVDGDLNGAIEQYQTIVDKFRMDRSRAGFVKVSRRRQAARRSASICRSHNLYVAA